MLSIYSVSSKLAYD